MRHLNKNKNNNHNHLIAATAATISVLAIAIILASTSIASPVAATTTNTTTTGNTTTTSSSPSGIKLSSQPIYQERSPPGGLTPINQTHGILTFTGNGTVTLPNSTQTINTTSNGTAVISFGTSSGYAKETIRAANGETANVTAYEIVQFNNPAAAPQGGGKGIVTGIFQTNSTGMLAPLNGVVAAGIDNMSTTGESDVTLWRWESGISNTSNSTSSNNSTGITAPLPSSPTVQGAPSMNSSISNTTTTANETSAPISSSTPLTAP